MTAVLHRSGYYNARGYIGPTSRARQLAATRASVQYPAPRTPINAAGLPRIVLTTDLDENVSDISSIQRGASGYVRSLEQPPPDDRSSTHTDDGYNRYCSRFDNDDEDKQSSIGGVQLRPSRFGGITRQYRREFGRGLSSLLSGRQEFPTTREQPLPDEHHSRQTDDGYNRYFSRYDNDDQENASSVGGVQLRPSRFGGITRQYRREFGRGLSSLLSGRQGFPTNSNSAETNRRAGVVGSNGYDAAASQQSNGSGSDLAR